MATAQTLIDRAGRLIGAIASGESFTATESADCLTALNAMLESWQTEKMVVYAFVDTALTMVATDASYTVGPAGNFALTPRPDKLENIFVRANDIDYAVEQIDRDRWYAIPDKTSDSDIPMFAYYEPTLPTGTLLLWPVPNSAYSLHVVTWTTVSSLAALSTSVALPQGYERAIAYNLAIEIAPEFGKDPSQTVVSVANESKAAIKRVNSRPMKAYTELGALIGGQRSNIYSGGYIA
jgi:hypothetical protein